jgi:hypothetical protein
MFAIVGSLLLQIAASVSPAVTARMPAAQAVRVTMEVADDPVVLDFCRLLVRKAISER